MEDFSGLVAAVTGGAGGIGGGTARLLTSRGATVVLLDLTEPADTEHPFVECDITDDAAIDEAMGTIRAVHGRLDVLVNNAGIGAFGDVAANDRAEWHRVLDVNVASAARVSAAALPLLRQSPSAAIVNVSSVVAVVGVRERALYSASKGAVLSLTLAMAADLLGDGIRVNAVAPGTADTPWVRRLLDAAADPVNEEARLKSRQPTGRLVTADEVAHAIAYLASPLSSATYGTVLNVDGGMANLRIN
jgi:NAD(P)-dependent dehydrogenase (short-subunit alcohol dehydrogenase family)